MEPETAAGRGLAAAGLGIGVWIIHLGDGAVGGHAGGGAGCGFLVKIAGMVHHSAKWRAIPQRDGILLKWDQILLKRDEILLKRDGILLKRDEILLRGDGAIGQREEEADF